MPYVKMLGRHFTIADDTLTVFRFSGFVDFLPDRTQRVVDSLDNAESQLVGPLRKLEDIEAAIEEDRVNGNEEKIDHIVISDEMAVMLWLEGTLTAEHFRDGEEDGESITIRMNIGGKERKVKIRPQTELGCAAMTIDADGIEI